MYLHSNKDIDFESQSRANDLNKSLLSIKKTISGHEFYCPWCKKKHNKSNSRVLNVVASEDLIDTQRMNMGSYTEITKTYAKLTCRVRICERCYLRNELNKKIFFNTGKALYFTLGTLCLIWAIATKQEASTIFLILFGCGIIALFAVHYKKAIIENFFDIANIHDAYRDNAID